jgi:ribosome-associated protein YbcJ (S4-like RNA binding protein)
MMTATIKQISETKEQLVKVNDEIIERRKTGIKNEKNLELINTDL